MAGKMAKSKSKSIVTVADGTGGMMAVEDRRFEKGGWPISFEVRTEREQADRWVRYLSAACHRRSWSVSSLGQLERAENSGTISIVASGKPYLDIVWEQRRGGPLKVRARPALPSEFPLTEAERFLNEVNDRCRSGATEPIYARGTLQFEGLAWRGELWLDDKLRLGPPSLQDETAILGPRIVHVDAILDCIGQSDVPYELKQALLELSAFLSVVLAKSVRLPDQGRSWTWISGVSGCEVRNLGYMEAANPLIFPIRGSAKGVRVYPTDRPPIGIDGSSNEISVREDINDLWMQYRSLGTEQRRQFLQAAAKWQEAMIHWQDRGSLSFALMVVACEALKPQDADDRQNCYHVIEALLGKSIAERLRQHPFAAQRVRSTHLHTGEFHGSELVRMAFMSTYQDPSFREAHRELARITPVAIIEWLKRQGEFDMPIVKQRKTIRRMIKENVFVVLSAAVGAALIFGWLARGVWNG
jgi:hypothetical protein